MLNYGNNSFIKITSCTTNDNSALSVFHSILEIERTTPQHNLFYCVSQYNKKQLIYTKAMVVEIQVNA